MRRGTGNGRLENAGLLLLVVTVSPTACMVTLGSAATARHRGPRFSTMQFNSSRVPRPGSGGRLAVIVICGRKSSVLAVVLSCQMVRKNLQTLLFEYLAKATFPVNYYY